MKIINSVPIIVVGLFISQSAQAVNCDGLSTWDSSTAYLGGHQVQYNTNAYEAKWWTQNQNPESHSGPWQEWKLLGACDGSGGNQNPISKVNGPYSGKEGEAISFSSAGSSDPDGNIVSVNWDFGDGNNSTQNNPTHTYTSAGSYTVTLKVTDNEGASHSSSTTATITSDGGGGSCDGVPQYVVGTAYSTGDLVSNVNKKYRCDIAGWCSSNAAWAYEPGVGAHWQSAWSFVSDCVGGPQPPKAMANGPYSATVGNAIAFSSAGSSDADGNIVSYSWDFGDGNSSTLENPSHTYSSIGSYTVSLTVTDNDGQTDTATTSASVNDGQVDPLPHRLLVGYWHNFDNGSTVIKMKDVIEAWDIINVSFAENKPGGQEGEVAFEPFNDTDADFIAGVRLQQSKGKKVLISLGGANAHIQLKTATARDNYIRTMGDIIARYGFDGMDIDLEGGSLSMDAGDTIANPKTPAIINLIDATRALKTRFGPDFILTMAPETAYVQGGLNNFGGIWGAYLPLIHALRNDLTVIHVQHYNTGSMYGTDGKIYQPGTADFHVAMADMLITGFDAASSDNPFPGLNPSQVAFGLPSGGSSASSGYTTPANVHKALDCLIKLTQCGTYQPGQAYTHFRGLMTWSINWDASDGYNFSTPHRAYLNQNP
ncbi:PKD domain-containing protein [Aliikangiella coralliicola]|uniref:chitinase n=1 Tax=Aliikangiella coralliicola TaxID=2592383 RepID=A0A545U4L7_9GAMM|nr:PKD domain-containing protein [Aliikangiella coralliicola]TQV84343.1 PKD domain-containing protein [Aliikangiella coralliicola]